MAKLDKRTLEMRESSKEFDNKRNSKFKKKGKRPNKWKGKVDNDPSWHGKNSQLVTDTCSKPWSRMAGFPIKLGNHTLNLPALKTFGIDWFAGVSSDFRSMLNTAATNLWEFIRGRNSGATNYQASDPFINVIFGCLDIGMTANFIDRIFRCVKSYSVFNRLIPKMLIEGQGIDFEDLNSNIANYRAKFNILLAKASSVVIPKQFPIYDWVLSTMANIYKDRDSSTGREQYYMLIKKFFHIFDPAYNPQGGGLRMLTDKDLDPSITSPEPITMSSDKLITMEKLLLILEKQIEAVITDEDTNIIFGDFIKAYGGESSFWLLKPLDAEASIEINYSEEFLYKIHNATFLPELVIRNAASDDYAVPTPVGTHSAYESYISQDAQGYILTDYNIWYPSSTKFEFSNLNDDYKYLLDTNDMNPTPEAVMNMTRFHNRYKYSIPETNRVKVEPTAASAVLLWNDYMYIGGPTGITKSYGVNQFITEATATVASGIYKQTQFDWYPIIYIKDTNGNSDTLADLNNVVGLTAQEVDAIHQVDYASLFDVPFTGKF